MFKIITEDRHGEFDHYDNVAHYDLHEGFLVIVQKEGDGVFINSNQILNFIVETIKENE